MYTTVSNEGSLVAAVSSITLAIKGQRALGASGIAAEVISLSPGESRRGCAYGLAFSPSAEGAARAALRAARIPVSQYLRKGGPLP